MSARLRAVAPAARAPSPDELLRQLLTELDNAETVVRRLRVMIDEQRRRYRDARPGTFMLPTIEQLRRDLLP